MGGRGVLEEFLFDGALAEPGDGAQPPGNGGPGAASCVQVAGEAFDVGAADANRRRERARHQVVNCRRSSA